MKLFKPWMTRPITSIIVGSAVLLALIFIFNPLAGLIVGSVALVIIGIIRIVVED